MGMTVVMLELDLTLLSGYGHVYTFLFLGWLHRWEGQARGFVG